MAKQKLHRRLGPVTAAAAGLAAPLFIGAASAQAQGAAAAAPATPPAKPWQNKITAGLTVSDGNSDSVQATVSAESQRKWERDELRIYGQFGYGKTRDQNTGDYTKSDDYVFADVQWNHLFTPKFYGGLRLGYRHDDIADLDYRFTISPLVGYYFIKNEKTLLNAEAGPSYIFEKQGGEEDDYLALRFAQRFEHKFSDKVRIWEFVEYLPEAEDWAANYIINAEVGLEAMLSKALSLRVVAQNTYDSEPAPGRDSNDFKLIAGVTYSFGL
jgi:putative salt-induced outer membrane protein YdiY